MRENERIRVPKLQRTEITVPEKRDCEYIK